MDRSNRLSHKTLRMQRYEQGDVMNIYSMQSSLLWKGGGGGEKWNSVLDSRLLFGARYDVPRADAVLSCVLYICHSRGTIWETSDVSLSLSLS
jgi:hypothetical protein